jgi:hypothetical protein
MQGVVKNNDLVGMLFSPIDVVEHEEDITIEQLDIIVTIILVT